METIVFRVARAHRKRPARVARWPFVETALAFLHLLGAERADVLRREGDRIQLGVFVGYAFSEPERLTDAHDRLRVRADLTPDDTRARALGHAANVAARWAAGVPVDLANPEGAS